MKLILFSLPLILSLIFTSQTFAHGGFEKRAGITTVYISQDPISPVVGQKVKLRLNFKDETITSRNVSEKNLVDFPLKLSVVDTFYGDASKDKVVYSKDVKTDVNGGIDFEYTFNKENYFDIDLDFVDKNGQEQEVGFLIYPRELPSEKSNTFSILISFTGGFILASLLFLSKKLRLFKNIYERRTRSK